MRSGGGAETMTGLQAPGRPESASGADGVGELLDAYHRLTGLPFRAVLRIGGREETIHDSSEDELAPEAATRHLRLESPLGSVEVLVTVREDRGGSEEVEFLERWLRRHLSDDRRLARYGAELEARREEISLLTSISETLGSVIDLNRAARVILREVVEVLGASRATLWGHVPEEEELELLASQGRTDPVRRRVAVGDRSSLVAWVFESQEPVLLAAGGTGGRDLPEEVRSAALDGYGGSSILVVPITYTPPEGTPRHVGAMTLVGREEESSFGEGDLRLVTAIASQIGAAIENGRLVREELDRQRMAAELGLAHDLQLTLLPEPEDFADLFRVAARCLPAESGGGDFFQLVRVPGGRLGVMVGDVTSHGITAALLMAHTMSAAAACAREEFDPGAVLRRLNRELRRELASAEMFVTVFYAVFEPAGSLRYASAGHPHAFLFDEEDSTRLEVHNLPLGVGEEEEYRSSEVAAGAGGGHLLVFTDGLFESLGPPMARAESRVVETARERLLAGGDEESALEDIFTLCAREGVEGACAQDDRTALLLRR